MSYSSYTWEGSSVLGNVNMKAVNLPKLLVLVCSCSFLLCPLVGVSPYG